MKNILLIISIAFLVAFFGCSDDKEGPVEPPADNPPTFTVFSQGVTLTGGQAGLQFFGRCETDDVNMISVRVTNPANQSVEYNLGNALSLRGQNFACQDPNQGYYKYTGTWTLTFRGNKAAGTKSSFEVSVQHAITGKEVGE